MYSIQPESLHVKLVWLVASWNHSLWKTVYTSPCALLLSFTMLILLCPFPLFAVGRGRVVERLWTGRDRFII
ncbi:hypothetical protein C8R43DRAFT_1014630 [Mycena crocata]|nr:hypothetical protein C8R43DRAFT_1014630 [Mycena crocata]